MNRNAMFNAHEDTEEISKQYIMSMIIFSAFALILGITLSVWLTHIIVGPVEGLTKAVNEIR